MDKMYSKILKIVFTIVIFITAFIGKSQNTFYAPNYETNIRIEKSHYNQEYFHSNIKPYDNLFSKIIDSTDNALYISSLSRFPNKLLNENFINKSGNGRSFNIDPIISLSPAFTIEESELLNNYLFGLSFSGSVGDKFSFRLNGLYGIKSFPPNQGLLIDSVNTLPFLGKYLSKSGNNYNFINFTGHLSYSPYKYLNFKFGVGNHFFGDGSRSLFLSQNSAPYPYIQTTVEVWRLKYIWLSGLLSDKNPENVDNKFMPKFLVSHFLSYNATKWLNFSFFEGIVSNPTDSAGLFHFEPGYLNPAIFLRPVEFSSGSTDNVVIGFGLKLKLLKKYQLYAQFLIDEFVISEIKSDSGWWGNKYGFQLGLNVFDLFGIKNLFTRIEFNQVRPYTYSYYNSFGNYGNHFQPLAHPMGANFREMVFESHYHRNRFSVQAHFISGEAGIDTDTISYGQDIYKSSFLRSGDYGNEHLQGLKSEYLDFGLKLAWIINNKAGLSVFASGQCRKYTNFAAQPQNTFILLGINCLLIKDELFER